MLDLRTALRILAVAVLVPALMLATSARAQEAAAPTVQVHLPGLTAQGPVLTAPTVTIGFTGADADGPTGLPTRVRFLFTAAEIGGVPVATRADYDAHVDELIAWDDPVWSPWMPYPDEPAQAAVTFPMLEADRYYLFAVQVLDTLGAVSVGRGYAAEVAHIHVLAGFYRPEVVLNEYFMGSSTAPLRASSIAAGQPLNFSWTASAAAYGGDIVSCRYGWDLADPDDPNDPGWAVPPGDELRAPERIFNEGLHVFSLKVVDDSGQSTLRQWQLSVVPFVDVHNQLELLLIDQVVDANVNNWPDIDGNPMNDESYRNAYWHFLAEGSGGVQGFDWDRDRFDHRDLVGYADLVAYKAVLCYASSNVQQLMFGLLRPQNGVDRYNWLAPYQVGGGNLMLVGANSMESVLEALPNYMAPLFFETPEEIMAIGAQDFVVGFGRKTLPDGSEVLRGTTMYPFATAGLSVLDWTTSSTMRIYARPFTMMSADRRVDCVGLKALVIDDGFRANWAVAAGDLADTVFTEPTIDWQDAMYAAGGTLGIVHNTFPFRGDEFVDANISSRTTSFGRQWCFGAPDDRCIEPMVRGVARFDWLREYHWAEGDTGWPASAYSAAELDGMCGELALTAYDGQVRGSAKTNGQTYGWLSYKNVADKPGGQPDVYWGFDPYRFDHVQSKKMVRWVLDMFGLDVAP
ncbi:MAG: hypothetical protein IH621_06935 [Krumholzibacteria bacterium]|nr:hypothetical protein [Candidatus Krumholzibacteria bacterium]